MEKEHNVLKDIRRLIFPDHNNNLTIRDEHKALRRYWGRRDIGDVVDYVE